MGSKFRLLRWIHETISRLEFRSALDAFSGSGCVGYLMKAMGKEVVGNDFLNFSHQIFLATIENSRHRISGDSLRALLKRNPRRSHFIENTFHGIFFHPQDLAFLDNVWSNIEILPTRYHRALAIAAMVRACVKRQPRGVFTVSGGQEHYNDGRRDLRLSLREHFLESVDIYNSIVFDNSERNKAFHGDVFEIPRLDVDLVYMDPPYVPRADDNCYVKRYHFLEGLSSYWTADGAEILLTSKVKKIPKRYTPFSYRRTAIEAFDKMFRKFCESTLVLSYSSNGFPDLDILIGLMRKYKRSVEIFEKNHRYHFGTHDRVSEQRSAVREYLIVGTK